MKTHSFFQTRRGGKEFFFRGVSVRRRARFRAGKNFTLRRSRPRRRGRAIPLFRVGNGFLRLVELFRNFFEQRAELEKFRLHGNERLGNFRGIFLHGERAEPHFQAVEQGGERHRSRDEHAAFPLDFFREPGAAQHFGVEPFRGQEQDAEIRRARRVQRFVADVAREGFHAPGEVRRGFFRGASVARLRGGGEPVVVFDRELRVDGQIKRLRGVGRVAGKLHGEFDDFGRAGRGPEIALELLRRENVFEQRAELNFAPGAARLHVGQNALEVGNAVRDRLHFAERAAHVLEAFADDAERFAEAFFQRALQFFFDDPAHFVELLRVFLADSFERKAQRFAAFVGGFSLGVAERVEGFAAAALGLGERLRERGEAGMQRLVQAAGTLGERVLEGVRAPLRRRRAFFAKIADGLFERGSRAFRVVAQVPNGVPEGVFSALAFAGGRAAFPQQQNQQRDGGGRQQARSRGKPREQRRCGEEDRFAEKRCRHAAAPPRRRGRNSRAAAAAARERVRPRGKDLGA